MAEDDKPAKAEALTYHRDRLIAESQAFFGQPSHLVVAALSMGRAGHKVHFTRDEADKLIEQALKHEVEIDHPHPEDEEA